MHLHIRACTFMGSPASAPSLLCTPACEHIHAGPKFLRLCVPVREHPCPCVITSAHPNMRAHVGGAPASSHLCVPVQGHPDPAYMHLHGPACTCVRIPAPASSSMCLPACASQCMRIPVPAPSTSAGPCVYAHACDASACPRLCTLPLCPHVYAPLCACTCVWCPCVLASVHPGACSSARCPCVLTSVHPCLHICVVPLRPVCLRACMCLCMMPPHTRICVSLRTCARTSPHARKHLQGASIQGTLPWRKEVARRKGHLAGSKRLWPSGPGSCPCPI